MYYAGINIHVAVCAKGLARPGVVDKSRASGSVFTILALVSRMPN